MPEETLRENKMGTMPIDKLIISMSLPIMISMLVQALYNIVAEDKILPYSPSSLGEIYRSVFFKCHEPCLAELMHHFRCGRFADIYLSREHAEANRAGLRTVAANHLKIVFLRRRESVFAPVFAAVESKKFFAAVHAHSPFSQMPILWYRETFFPRVNLY